MGSRTSTENNTVYEIIGIDMKNRSCTNIKIDP